MTPRLAIYLSAAFTAGFLVAVTLLNLRLQIHITHTVEAPLVKRTQKP